MPWRVESMRSQKQKFIDLYELHRISKTDLCQHFHISRPTGDRILKRYSEEGYEALGERSRKPLHYPNQTSQEIEDALVAKREKYHWGARKLLVLVQRDMPGIPLPSETTVNHILHKHGLIAERRKPRRRVEVRKPKFEPEAPNEIWSADFKGKFRLGNAQYCNPLTIADSYSRYLFAISGLERADAESCKSIFDKTFREYGLPEFLHTDNGSPFGSTQSLRRMTMLSVWLMELGIIPVYSDPASPGQNGRHERMHRDLKREATRPPGGTFRSQQRLFNQFRETYNTIRPHESLGMKTPAQVHVPSSREYPHIIREWEYDTNVLMKMVTVNGAIRWKNQGFVMISSALGGKYIGMEEVETGLWALFYRQVPLGYFDEPTGKIFEVEDLDF